MSQESKSFKLSAFEDCGVCCLLAKDYIKCVYCSEKACFDCYETYLLDQHVDKCMFCNKNWSYEFVQTSFRPAFINGKYKDKKKVLMFEREKALLPATQTELAEEERYKAYTMKQRVLNSRTKILHNDIKHYSKIARARASTKKEKEEAITMIDELIEKITKIREKATALYTAHYGEGHEEKKVEEVKREPVIPCSMNDCRGYLTRNNEERKLECGMCKTRHCHKCRCKKEEEHKCDPNIVETVKLLASDTKPCPKCSIPIFKIAGCFAQDVDILLYDGTTKKSQDIEIGDVLVGDDGNPRKVLDLCSGEDKLYSVNQNNGVTYTVNSKHQLAYDTYFIIKTTPKRGRKVTFNMPAVNQYIKRYAGFQALLSNSIKDPVKALQVYRDKDVVEKCFDDLKNQLDMKRLRMHSSATTDGRLFVQFIALIYVSALRKEMRKSDLIKHYNVRELLQETETLVKIKYSGKYGCILTEMTKPQREILSALNIGILNGA